MKDIYDILDSTPEKDTVDIQVVDPDGFIHYINNITEEQIRWIQVQIARNEYPNDKVAIVNSDGTISHFAKDGRLDGTVKGNILSLNRDLAMDILLAKCSQEVE